MSRLSLKGMPRSASATSRRTAGDASVDSRRASARTEVFDLPQGTKRGDADLWVGIGELLLDGRDAGRAEVRHQPERARAVERVGIVKDRPHCRQRCAAVRL